MSIAIRVGRYSLSVYSLYYNRRPTARGMRHDFSDRELSEYFHPGEN